MNFRQPDGSLSGISPPSLHQRDVIDLGCTHHTHISVMAVPWYKLKGFVVCQDTVYRGYCQFLGIGENKGIPSYISAKSVYSSRRGNTP